jgi:5-methylcytosine-specific restriction endonuclease McrA
MSDVLVLNADGQPINFLPLSTIKWKEAITYMWNDKVHVLDWYDDWMVRSPSWETRVPAVIMIKTCQYCLVKFEVKDLTIDHVIPVSKGGKTEWTNIVAACGPCNSSKSNKLISPKNKPHAPGYYELVRKQKQLQRFELKHPSWEKFIT